jgi:hypothetical protein
MRKTFFIAACLCFSAAGALTAQEGLDPETMKMMQQYQQQSQDVPAELLSLMPKGIDISSKNWMLEPSSKMMFQLGLQSAMSTKLENTEDYQLEVKISLTAYNLSSPGGKAIADAALRSQQSAITGNWTAAHPEKKSAECVASKPEKITVARGFILIQKIFMPRHADGEGMVPERTEYCGLLYQDVDGGFLTAEIGSVPNTKAGIEKWLKQIASAGAKIKPDKYFK